MLLLCRCFYWLMVYWFLSRKSLAFIIFHFNYTRRVIWRLASLFFFLLSTLFTGKWLSKRLLRSTKQFKKTSSFPHLLLFANLSQMGWMILYSYVFLFIDTFFFAPIIGTFKVKIWSSTMFVFNQTAITFNKIPVNAKKNLLATGKCHNYKFHTVIIHELLLHSSVCIKPGWLVQ